MPAGEAGEVGPALFFMLSDSLVESFRARLDALGLELADLRIGGTQHRPLVQVRIEWPPSEPPLHARGVEPGARTTRALASALGAVRGPRGPGDGGGARARAGAHRGRSRRVDGRARAPRGGAAAGAAGRNSRRAFGGGLVTRNP